MGLYRHTGESNGKDAGQLNGSKGYRMVSFKYF